MDILETPNTLLRPVTQDDWQDVMSLAEDWNQAPGPAFDKWPTGEQGAKGMTSFFANHPDKYLALEVKSLGTVVGLIAINGYEGEGEMDLGHVIHSEHQDNRLDLEALTAVVEYLFGLPELTSIITKNADHPPQLAPLRTLGFRCINPDNPGILSVPKLEWMQNS